MADTKEGHKQRLAKAKKGLEEVGRGLYQGQIEMKLAPWQVNWEYLEAMIEQQEEMIALLKDIKASLECLERDGEREERIGVIAEIESADPKSLREMCARAKLDQRGGPDAMRTRLYKYYKIR